MAEFHEIGSSQFTETTNPTGDEMIQISATQKVKLKTIITALIRYGLTTDANGAYPGNSGLINRTILESFGLTTISGVNTALTRTATQNKLTFKSRSRKDKTNAFGDEAENLNVFFEVATQALAGLMSAADKQKLDEAVTGGPYLLLAGGTMKGNLVMGQDRYLQYSEKTGGTSMIFYDGTKTILGGVGEGTTQPTLLRSILDPQVNVTAGSNPGTFTIWHSGNLKKLSQLTNDLDMSGIKISGWSDITKYEDVQDPYIQNGDTLKDALRKLQWMVGNNLVKSFGDKSGIGMMFWDGDTQSDLFSAFYLEIETAQLYLLFEASFSDLGPSSTEEQIISYIINEGNSLNLNQRSLVNYKSSSLARINLLGRDSIWFTGSSNPTIDLSRDNFSEYGPTATFMCPYNITPTFLAVSGSSIHYHSDYSTVKPTSGYKVYTIYCQVVSSTGQFAINVAAYN